MKDFPEKDPADPRPTFPVDPGPSTSANMGANSHSSPALPMVPPHDNDLSLLPQPLSEKEPFPSSAYDSKGFRDHPTLSRTNSLTHSIDMEKAALGIPGPLEDLSFPRQTKNPSETNAMQNRTASASISWNNVRLSLKLSPLAASQLEHKTSAASPLLSKLGLLNLQIGQCTPVSLSSPASSNVPLKSSPAKPEKKRKPRTQPKAATLSKNQLAENHPVPTAVNGDASAMAVVQHFLNRIAQQRQDGKSPSLPGSSVTDLQHLQPNVVATTSQPIPLPSPAATTLAAPTGPFPFSSMTKVAYTLKSTLASSHAATSSTVTTVEAVRESSVVSTTTAAAAQKPKISHQRNIALTSPLLVNLLQGNEIPAPLTVPAVKKTKRKKREKSPPPVPVSAVPNNLILPVKKPPRQRKKKKLDEEAVNGSSPVLSLPAPVPPVPSVMFRPPPADKGAKIIPPKPPSEYSGQTNTPTTANSATYMVFAISTPGSTPSKSSSSVSWSMPNSLPVDMLGNVVTTPVLVNSLDGIGQKGKLEAQIITPPGNGRKTPKLVMVRPPPGKDGGGTPNADNSTSSLDSGISLGLGTDDHARGRPVSLMPESGLELKVGPESECPS